MARILVNGSLNFDLVNEGARVMSNFEFDKPHLIEIGFRTLIPDEIELILSDFNGTEDHVIDNSTPVNERSFKFKTAHPNCSIAAVVKTGTAPGTYHGDYFYTISALDD
jgi:hypothetical protein